MTEKATTLETTPHVTTDVIKANFNLALTQNNFQKIQTEVDKLSFTEDNLETISAVIKKLGSLKKVVDATHETGKKPYLTIGRMFDTVKNDFYGILDGIITPVQTKYTQLCVDIEKRRKERLAEEQRVNSIKSGIDGNVLAFSQKIAAANTLAELLNIERMVNLEKANKNKYQEFLSEAVARFDELLNAPLKNQKAKVKELEDIKEAERKAIEEQNEEAMIVLQQKKEEVQDTLAENKENVQQGAINYATRVQPVAYAQEVIPEVKVRRKSWKWEVKDIKELQKKMPHLVKLIPDDEKIDDLLKSKKSDGSLEGTEEVSINGIRFYLEIKF